MAGLPRRLVKLFRPSFPKTGEPHQDPTRFVSAAGGLPREAYESTIAVFHAPLGVSDPGDILPTCELQVSCYTTKPLNLEHFFAVVESLENFWLTMVKLPEG